MQNPALVVMAAGIGSRYGGLKQVDPVGPSGEIVLDYAVYDALRAGFGKVVFVIRRDIEELFRDKVGRNVESRAETAYVCQDLSAVPEGFTVPAGRSKPWGTAHAALTAAPEVHEPCAVINADDYYGPGSFRVLADHLRAARDSGGVYDWSMVGFRLRNTVTEHGHVSRGVCTTGDGGHLATIVERTHIETAGDRIRWTDDGEHWTDIDPESVVSMNMWGFTPSVFAELDAGFAAFLAARAAEPEAEYFLPTVVNQLIEEHRARVRVLPTDEKWYGVTYQEDRPALRAFLQEQVAAGRYPQALWG